MTTDNSGLTKVPRTNRQYDSYWEYRFTQGDVREAFQRVFSPEGHLVLFQTVANIQAVEALKQYIGSRREMSSPWEVEKLEDEPKESPNSGNRRILLFDNHLMDSYQRAIDEIANRFVGQDNFSRYPIVHTDGVHSCDRDPNAIFWPRTYIVRSEKENELKRIIDELAGDKSLELLRQLESPQFYEMAEIETLHRLNIVPILRLERELNIGAQNLSTYVDFLAQMTETYRWTGPVVDED